jgi:ribosomal protein S18 acetylase RimI-like enzyme
MAGLSPDVVTIRPAVAADAGALADLKLATFLESFVEGGFRIPYPPADLAGFIAATYSAERVAAELADPERAQWIAEAGGRMLGYVHVGPCKLPHPEAWPRDGEIFQLYVRDEAQGARLGRRLFDVALDYLALTRPGPLWLGVWSGNHRAQAIYAGYGFGKVGDYLFPVGDWTDQEYIFRRGG